MKKSELLALLGKNVKGYSVEEIYDGLTTITVEMDILDWEHINQTSKYILQIDPKDKNTISVVYDAGDDIDTIELD